MSRREGRESWSQAASAGPRWCREWDKEGGFPSGPPCRHQLRAIHHHLRRIGVKVWIYRDFAPERPVAPPSIAAGRGLTILLRDASAPQGDAWPDVSREGRPLRRIRRFGPPRRTGLDHQPADQAARRAMTRSVTRRQIWIGSSRTSRSQSPPRPEAGQGAGPLGRGGEARPDPVEMAGVGRESRRAMRLASHKLPVATRRRSRVCPDGGTDDGHR